jgi:Zn-finger nucleic acid-binding protein
MTATPGRCPRCSTTLSNAGWLRVCHACKGLWLTERKIADHIRVRCPGDSGELVFVEGDGTALPCPACGDPMAACFLEGVPVDRCHAHGVWFDVDELERALKAARARPVRPAARVPPTVAVAGVQVAPAMEVADGASTGGSVDGWIVIEVLGDVLCAVVELADW